MSGVNPTLTAIPGFRVGHWTDPVGLTGCTVILCPDAGAVASASFLGPSPGTREGVLLAPGKKVERVHALLLTGGSAFGLAAAAGVVRVLEERGVGHETPWARVPIVPAAVIYDLGVGDPGARPGEREGEAAARAASSDPVPRGRVGAGMGATAGKYLGVGAVPGGLGSVYMERHGVRVGALAVVNPIGDVLDERGGVLAGPGVGPGALAFTPGEIESTTLIAVATEHTLTKADARRFADAAQTALGRVIAPSHTFWDGDSAFMLSSCTLPPADPLLLGALVQEAVCAAVRDAVRSAAGAE
ncbi:peptidase S58 family protein [Deinococcus metallilatus]|uniref:L-aminopeptidase/D-esterase-like protein n=1 Tax=Deinococcus metallilatus TaxID=1211322 RepID=A0AAJ5F1M5_9DEIO|nr:P1 family peptidase [Deinococcus metallilatus]MBB5297088.1 L-aminopeptidase/D-esterase-like protein [Deinococcus metallilatus]QBY07780.1 peptidase S58 family protein [Deinococcus metallilatus]RXJ13480.1 peptidase S58 family protein [Deinococcus metallilatus]TLK22363.1 P1 family peptidase [Deinococcus metallilatus]